MKLSKPARVGFVSVCAGAAWLSRPDGTDTHWADRQSVIRSALAQTRDPVIILGDSIVELSQPRRDICGHPVVNAGIGGATTTSGLDTVITGAPGGLRPTAILMALGTNDAAKPASVVQFREDYRALIAKLAPLRSRLAILGIPAPEPGLEEAKKVSEPLIAAYNAMLPALAGETKVSFVPMPSMPPRHTLDGIHLNAAGYAVWNAAVSGGLEQLVCASNNEPKP